MSNKGIFLCPKIEEVVVSKKYKYTKTFTFEGKRYFVRADTQEALFKKMWKKQANLENNMNSSSMRFLDWSERCINTYKINCSEKTKQDFICLVNTNINKYIGMLPLKSIKQMHCQDIINRQKGKSVSQISKVYQALQFIFLKAKQEDLISRNPAEFIEKPRGTKKKRRALTQEEQTIFTDVAKCNRKNYGFLLMLYCGCRPSEAYACKLSDIIQTNDIYLLHIKGTKTVMADRFVPLPYWLYELFIDNDGEYICQLSNGSKVSRDYMKLVWASYKRTINLKMGAKTYRNQLIEPLPLSSDIVQYCLRHTYCTNLAKAKIDIRTAQKLMGHADIQMTANIYTHIDNTDIVDAARQLCDVAPTVTKCDSNGIN